MAPGLQWQAVQIPLSAGLNQKSDPRALQTPALAVCLDAQFTELGGLQTRYPYAALGNNILGGGTISNPRRLVSNRSELLLFTDVGLYSWSVRDTAWVFKGTHLATKLDEGIVFGTNGDQLDADRAELNGTIVYTWVEGIQPAANGNIYVAATDKATGAVILPPTFVSGGVKPRVVALATKILLFIPFLGIPGALNVVAIDPANVATSVAATPTVIANQTTSDYFYDATQLIGSDAAVFVSVSNTGYVVGSVTAGLSVSNSAKTRTAPSTTAPVGLSCTPDGLSVQIVRIDASGSDHVLGDLITISTLADVFVGTSLGSAAGINPTQQIACAHRSVKTGGQYRCYVWWDVDEIVLGGSWNTHQNWVDTANTVGTEITNSFLSLGPASRAFDYAGQVYFWTAFAGQSNVNTSGTNGVALQNTYFLFRDDGFLVAKSSADNAGGFPASVGHLPGVALTNGSTTFSWCGGERRVIPGPQTTHAPGYGARAPRDVSITFDSNDARRCARIGQTLYITGGEVLGYDGVQLAEVGFHIYPWALSLTRISISGGAMASATYAYKSTFRWDNAAGDRDRSTTATITEFNLTGGLPQGISANGVPTCVTHKTTSLAAVEYWRTVGNPPVGAPFFLVTSLDPSVSNPNGYIANDPTLGALAIFDDVLADASASVLSANPENGSILENLAPPAASIIAATADRVFLAGIAGSPNTVWYSKQRNDGEVAAFNDALTIAVPLAGGKITALGFINETLVVWRERACYVFDGSGFDNGGGGSNYGPARDISTDVGCVAQESVARTPQGLIFKSSKGWYVLGPGWQCQYIGAAVANYDGEDIQSVHVLEAQHQIRCLSNERVLMFDYIANQWAEWTISDGLGACLWNGSYVYLSTSGAKQELPSFTGVTYGQDVELPWVKPQDLQGSVRVRRILINGEFRDVHALRVRVAYDYQYDGSGNPLWVDDTTWIPPSPVVGSVEQLRHGPSVQQCEAIKVRLTVVKDATNAPCLTEGIRLTGIAFEVGAKPGLYRRLPAVQAQ